MIFPALYKFTASSHYKGMYPHGSPIVGYPDNFDDFSSFIPVIHAATPLRAA